MSSDEDTESDVAMEADGVADSVGDSVTVASQQDVGSDGAGADSRDGASRVVGDVGRGSAGATPECPAATARAEQPSIEGSTEVSSMAGAAADGDPAGRWVAEVLGMAERLQELAASVPSASRRSSEAVTDLTGAEVPRLEEAHARLQALRAEARSLRADAETDIASAAEARRRRAAAMAAEEVRAQERRAAAEARLRAEARRSYLDELQAQVERQRCAAAQAQAVAAAARTAREQALALPGALAGRQASAAKASDLDMECQQLRRTIGQLRGELESVSSCATARVESLEARISHLDTECRNLQGQLTARAAASCSDAEALEAAQESNRCLLAEVRQARADRNQADEAASRLRRELAEREEADGEGGLELEIRKLRDEEYATRVKVDALRQQIGSEERRTRDLEEAAQAARHLQVEVDREKRTLLANRRSSDEAAQVSEWKLRKVLDAMSKEKALTGFQKCLLSARPVSSGTLPVTRGPADRASWSKRGGFAVGFRARGSTDDVDLESTTAASETVADGPP